MKYIYIHLGLHKTGTSFLQKQFFSIHSQECGYINLRKEGRVFLDYIINSNEWIFDHKKAFQYFNNVLELSNIRQDIVTISDEQFCGSPWNDAKDRKLYFDRLNKVFPFAKYIIVFRNQDDITESLYLQYVKTGGAANIEQFLTHNRHPLEFSRKSYLDYGSYVQYINERIGKNRLLCLYYEDMEDDVLSFLSQISDFIGFELSHDINKIVKKRENPSIPPYSLIFMVRINRLFKSIREPFNMLPAKARNFILKILLSISSNSRKRIVSVSTLRAFCREPKKKNYVLYERSRRNLKMKGY
jgi:hypothetical protein